MDKPFWLLRLIRYLSGTRHARSQMRLMGFELKEVKKAWEQSKERCLNEACENGRLQSENRNLQQTHGDEMKTIEDLLETVQCELTDTRLLLRQLAFDGSTDEAIKRIERYVKKGE